jgi:hypothetical protein
MFPTQVIRDAAVNTSFFGFHQLQVFTAYVGPLLLPALEIAQCLFHEAIVFPLRGRPKGASGNNFRILIPD